MSEIERVAWAIVHATFDEDEARGISGELLRVTYIPLARAAIEALDGYRAEEKRRTCMHYRKTGSGGTGPQAWFTWRCPDCGESYDSRNLTHCDGDWQRGE
jgi:hypothetical protein